METQMFNEKHLLYKDDNFELLIQPVNDVVHLHCNVQNWKLSTLKTMYKVFAATKEFVERAGYTKMATITPNPKFAKLFGGEVVKEFELDYEYYEVIVWEWIPSQLQH